MGPTASGKTGLAIELARRLDGEIINADSMQIYRDLRTITARPSPDEESQAPHHLFGILDASDTCNAQRWTELAEAKITEIQSRNKHPIIVGGTGFYIRSLTEGLDEIPPISVAVREAVRALSTEQAHQALADEDPSMAARFAPADGQRIRRALEVLRETGRSLAEFQTGQIRPDEARFSLVKLLPDREDLYARCDLRLELMWEESKGEVAAYLASNPDPAWPLSKAIGVPQIADVLNAAQSDASGLALAQQKTRNYAKRQLTWLRNQHQDATKLSIYYSDAQYLNNVADKIETLIQN